MSAPVVGPASNPTWRSRITAVLRPAEFHRVTPEPSHAFPVTRRSRALAGTQESIKAKDSEQVSGDASHPRLRPSRPNHEGYLNG